MSGAPLAGVTIVSVEQFGAGPFATLYLVDLGARVIKIEDPKTAGDVARSVPPGVAGSSSLYFETFNRGKSSLALDLKSADGRAAFERLVGEADAVFNNLRGDLVVKLGLDYATLGRLNPAIVCVSLSAYGRAGPRAAYPGYDALVQAEAGWAALTGEPDAPPTKSGLSLVDYTAGLNAALGLMVALFDARRTGQGRDVDVNLYDSALALLSYPATWYLSRGINTERLGQSAHPSLVPFQFFQTADGYVAIACAKERFFQLLAPLVGRPELLDDARFTTFEARRLHRAALVELLEATLREAPTAHWLATLGGVVPAAPVRSMAEALDAEELSERGMLVSYEHPELGSVRALGTPIVVGDYTPSYRPAPLLDPGSRVKVDAPHPAD
ncbi:MAG: CoA transferase [Chloroflexi bacterium]|nr:CoA transferase [Chloroflexota bacterium]